MMHAPESQDAAFRWEDAERELDWLPGGWLNMAHEAVDRHANGRRRDKTSMIWEGKGGQRERYTFGELKGLTGKFANVLKSLGLERGDRVAMLMERVPELYVSLLGTLKAGAVAAPLSPTLTAETVRDCLKDSATKVLVTHPYLRRRITGVIPELFDLQHIVVVNRDDSEPFPLDMADLGYQEEMDKATPNFDIWPTRQYDESFIQYTAGATDRPVGVVHRHHGVLQHYVTGKWLLGLQEEDVYWCVADPGDMTHTSCGILTPWTHGVTQLIHEGEPSAGAWFDLARRHGVSVWLGSPETVRVLAAGADGLRERGDLPRLRHAGCVGESIDGASVRRWAQALGTSLHFGWQQPETGAPVVATYPAADTRSGCLGRPAPGVEAAVLGDDYEPVGQGEPGTLALRPGWPSMFGGYRNDAEAYRSRFRRGWYVSGVRARQDESGLLWPVTGPAPAPEGTA